MRALRGAKEMSRKKTYPKYQRRQNVIEFKGKGTTGENVSSTRLIDAARARRLFCITFLTQFAKSSGRADSTPEADIHERIEIGVNMAHVCIEHANCK